MKFSNQIYVTGMVFLSLSVTACSVVEPEVEAVAVTSATLPADDLIAKNIEQLLVDSPVAGRPNFHYTEISDIKIIGKFPIEQDWHYQLFVSMRCQASNGANDEPAKTQMLDTLSLKRLDTNKWALHFDAGDDYRWQVVKE